MVTQKRICVLATICSICIIVQYVHVLHYNNAYIYTDKDQLSIRSHMWCIFCHLRRFVNDSHHSLNTQRHVFMVLIAPVQHPHPLTSCMAPVVQEALHQEGVLKLDVVYMPIFLEKRPHYHK